MIPLLSYMYGILIIILIMFIFAVIGKGFSILSGYNCNSLTAGFLLSSAIFYISAFPFMIVHGSLMFLTVLYVFEICAAFTWSLYICFVNKGYNNILVVSRLKNNPFLTICVIFGTVIIVLLIILYHSDADDSFYLAQSSTILESGRINPYEQSTGIAAFSDQTQYSLVGYEIWTAVICFVFNINTAVLYHSLLPVMFIIMHFLVMYDIGKALFKNNASVFLILIMCFDILGGYSVYSQGAFAMLRLWQGKAVLVNVIMPFLMLVFIKIFRNKDSNKYDIDISKYDKIMLYTVLLSGLFISVVGLYLVPIEYALFFTVYFIYALIGHKVMKDVFSLILPVAGVLPFVAVYFLCLTSDNVVQIATDNAETLSYMHILKDINGTGIIIPVFILAVLFFAMQKKSVEKCIFAIYPFVGICTFANPLICRYVARYITGTPVYWRVFWLFSFNITICAAVISVYSIVKKYRAVYIVISMMIIILCGKPIFTGSFFEMADNFEKIDVVTKNTADAILEREDEPNSLMIPEEYGYGIRQYTGKIIMIWSRYSSLYYQNEGSYDRIKEIYDLLYTKKSLNFNVYNGLCDFDTDYVLMYDDTVFGDDVRDKFQYINKYGDFVLYKIS